MMTRPSAVPRRPRRQLPAAQAARGARRKSRRARSRRSSCARSRTRRSARSCKLQEDVGPAGHHRRRVPPHLLPHRLPRAARRRRDRMRGHHQVPQPDGRRRLAPPVMHVTGKVRHARPIQRADFEFLKSVTPAHAEGDDPLAHDAAFPRRARRDQQASLSRPGGVLRRRRGRLPRGDRARSRPPAARYLQLDDTNLAYLCDTKMREAARAARRRSGRAAAPLRAS